MSDTPHMRLPAEWEFDCDILMAWPHSGTDWNYMLPQVRKCYIDMIEAFTSHGLRVILIVPDSLPDELKHIDSSKIIPVRFLTNDTWTRDYGPVTLTDTRGRFAALDFTFNAWGMKFAANRDNFATRHLFGCGLLTGDYRSQLDFVLEGGGIESDGNGSLLTTASCQYSPNRNAFLTPEEIDTQLKKRLGMNRLHVMHHGYLAGDDTDSHIDTLARFAPGDTILYVGCDDPSDEHFTELDEMKKELAALRTAVGQPYNLLELPLPDPVYDADGMRLPATYANFLATPQAVFLPVYGQKAKDFLAEQILQIVFSVPVVPVDCSALIQQHGSLHCATMQIPKQLTAI